MLWGILEGAARVLQAFGAVYDAGAALVQRVRKVKPPPAPTEESHPLPWADVARQRAQADAAVSAARAANKDAKR